MVEIMRIDGDAAERYTCAMPRHYAVPLILLNKRLAFFEAQCRPDGTPLSIRVPAMEGGSSRKSTTMKRQDMREYAYLWRLRGRFLREVEAADVHQIRDVLRGELIERRIALAVIVVIHVRPVGAVVDGVVQFRLCRAGRVCGAGCNRQNDNTC